MRRAFTESRACMSCIPGGRAPIVRPPSLSPPARSCGGLGQPDPGPPPTTHRGPAGLGPRYRDRGRLRLPGEDVDRAPLAIVVERDLGPALPPSVVEDFDE